MEPIKSNEQSPLYFPRKNAEITIETMLQYPLTAITAPMGYGKTALLRNYLIGRKKLTCWLVLNQGDNSLKYFWGKMLRELGKVDKMLAEALVLYGFPSTVDKLAGFFDLFLKSEFASQERYIVFDNYQYIHNPQIHNFIQFIAQEQIEGMHLFILTRNSVPGNFLECSISKIMGVMHAQEFEFSAEEIQEFFCFNGCKITAEQANKFYLYSQGWITAIYLMMLNYQQTGEINIPGNLEKLVEATMYAQYDEKIRSFLKMLSAVENCTAEAAAYITGNENAGNILKKLVCQNSFIKYNQKPHIYLMHPVLRTFLYRKLMSGNREEAARLNRRAGEYMLYHESHVQGLEMLYKAGANEEIVKFLKDKPFDVWKEVEIEDLIRYFSTLDQDLKMMYYVTYLRFILFIAADNRFELAQLLILDAMDLYKESWLSRNDGDRHLRGEIYLVEAVCYAFQPRKALESLRLADELLSKGSEIIDRNAAVALECISLLGIAHEERGNLCGAVGLCQEISERLLRLTGSYGCGASELCRAEYHWWRGELKDAEKLLYVALQKAQTLEQTPIVLRCVYFLIRKLMFDGSHEKIQNLMQLQHQVLMSGRNYEFIQLYNMYGNMINTALGDLHNLAEWKLTEEAPAKNLARRELVWKYLTMAEISVSLQNWQEVIFLCQKTKPHFINNYKIIGLIYTNIFEAVANMHLYTADFGKVYLRAALELAQPDGIIIPFVLNCENIMELLNLLKKDREVDAAFIDAILELSQQYQKGLQTICKNLNPKEERVDFTPREKEMISYLMNCQSNKEIAYNMGVKIGTVKKMMYNIFQKLQVNCRASAIKKIMNCEIEL